MFDIAVATVGKANNIDLQASQQSIHHMCNGTTLQPISSNIQVNGKANNINQKQANKQSIQHSCNEQSICFLNNQQNLSFGWTDS